MIRWPAQGIPATRLTLAPGSPSVHVNKPLDLTTAGFIFLKPYFTFHH